MGLFWLVRCFVTMVMVMMWMVFILFISLFFAASFNQSLEFYITKGPLHGIGFATLGGVAWYYLIVCSVKVLYNRCVGVWEFNFSSRGEKKGYA